MSECKGSAPASGRNKSVIKNPDEAGDSPVLLLNWLREKNFRSANHLLMLNDR